MPSSRGNRPIQTWTAAAFRRIVVRATSRGAPERALRILVASLLVAGLIRVGLVAWRLPLARFADAAVLGPPERPRLLFLFQPGDCESYDGLIRRWNDIHADGEIPVLGAALRFPADTAARRILLWSAGTEFPVRFDLASRIETLALRLGYRRTPLSILVDGGGRPLLVVPPVRDPAVQDRYEEIVRMIGRSAASTPGTLPGPEKP